MWKVAFFTRVESIVARGEADSDNQSIAECEKSLSHKLYPEFDVVKQNDPTAYLAMLKIRLLNAEDKIKSDRKNMKNIRYDLDKQWKSLNSQEKNLRENFEHFDKFVRENIEKRERASKKIQEDVAICEQRKQDIFKLEQIIEAIQEAKRNMDKKIREYSLFEQFLENVVSQTTFRSITEVINRYLALLNARNYLVDRQEINMKAMETGRSDMIKLMEEKKFIIMGLNNQIASLQARFENATIKALEGEQLVIEIKNNAVEQMDEIDEAKASIWNIFQHMALSKKHPIKIKKENVEDQMVYIKRTLTELSKVNQILQRRSKLLNKSKTKL